ncbi:MAG: coenzyme F420-0:L-glutamate ligase [Candidatus Odinarchaeia archaeon]
MILYPIKTPLIRPGNNILTIVLTEIEKQGLKLREKDILVFAESAVATSQNRIVRLSEVKPSGKAIEIGKKYDIDPRLVEVILGEADRILGGVSHVLLTLKDNVFQANAGVDKSNAPGGYVTLLPKDPVKTAEEYRKYVFKKYNVKIGVIIADSRTQPLRLGNVGLALGVAGFNPVEDLRGRADLYGKRLRITRSAVADNLASAAEVLMGESDESIPAVLIRGAPVTYTERSISMEEMFIPPDECLYVSVFGTKDIR